MVVVLAVIVIHGHLVLHLIVGAFQDAVEHAARAATYQAKQNPYDKPAIKHAAKILLFLLFDNDFAGGNTQTVGDFQEIDAFAQVGLDVEVSFGHALEDDLSRAIEELIADGAMDTFNANHTLGWVGVHPQIAESVLVDGPIGDSDGDFTTFGAALTVSDSDPIGGFMFRRSN